MNVGLGITSRQGALLDETTAAIKQAIDIVELVGETVRLEPLGSKFRGLCPFHDDHKPSFTVDPEYQNYRCWACGAHGDVFSFVQEIERVSFVDAKRLLAERAGISLRSGKSGSDDPKQSLYRVLAWAQEEYRNCLWDARTGQEARQYLKERGVKEETAAEHGLGVAPDAYEWLIHRGKANSITSEMLIRAGLCKMGNRQTPYDAFYGRLLFPIRDSRGRVLGFGGRLLPGADNGKRPKYINTPGTDVYHKSRVLYGVDVAKKAVSDLPKQPDRRRMLLVMEGYMDCLMAYQHGVLNAVATCGTALTAQHVGQLRNHADGVVLMFDGDQAGRKAAHEAVTLFLNAELDVRLCLLPDNKDPCDLLIEQGADGLRACVDQAPDALDFQIQRARADHEQNTVEGSRKALEQVLQTLANVPMMAEQSQAIKFDLTLNRLTEAFGVTEQKLRQRIAEMRRRNSRPTPRLEQQPAQTPVSLADRRERLIAQLLAVQPVLAKQIQPLFPAANVEHPQLRAIVKQCYSAFETHGERAGSEHVRERIDDSQLGRLLFELQQTAPKEEAFEQMVKDVLDRLREKRRREDVEAARRKLAPGANESDHLNLLRQLRDIKSP